MVQKINKSIIIVILILIFIYILCSYYGTINPKEKIILNKLPINYSPVENSYELILIYNKNYKNIKSTLLEWLKIQKKYHNKIIKNKKINIYSADILEYSNIGIDKNSDAPIVYLVSKYIFFELNNSINQSNIDRFLNEKL